MSTAAGSPTKEKLASPQRVDKGKAKNTNTHDEAMEEEDDDDDDDEDDGDEDIEEDDDDDDEDNEEIDPSAIIGGRRTRGIKVDYTSKEALQKAGLKAEEGDDEDEDMHPSND